MKHMLSLIGGLSDKNKNKYQYNKKLFNNILKKVESRINSKTFNLKNLMILNNYIKRTIKQYNINYQQFSSFILSELTLQQKKRFKTFSKLYNAYSIKSSRKSRIDTKYIIKYLVKNIKNLKFYDNKIYKKNDLLGKGASGQVFSITNVNDKVLKYIELEPHILSGPHRNNTKVIKRRLNHLINEIDIMLQLNGTKISPTLHDYWLYKNKNNNKVYLVLLMEKMDISLSDWLSQGHSLSKEAYQILKDKVKQLHNKNIIHKDLFSRNVLLKYKDKCVNEVIPYISDFEHSESFDKLIDDFKKHDIKTIEDQHNESKETNYQFFKNIIVAILVHTNISITI